MAAVVLEVVLSGAGLHNMPQQDLIAGYTKVTVSLTITVQHTARRNSHAVVLFGLFYAQR